MKKDSTTYRHEIVVPDVVNNWRKARGREPLTGKGDLVLLVPDDWSDSDADYLQETVSSGEFQQLINRIFSERASGKSLKQIEGELLQEIGEVPHA